MSSLNSMMQTKTTVRPIPHDHKTYVYEVYVDGPCGSQCLGMYSSNESAQARRHAHNLQIKHPWDKAEVARHEVLP